MIPTTQEEIQQYIDNAIEESLILEYKAADSLGKTDGKKKEITKDVSAMANSAGGTIIYGVKEFDEEDKKHLPEKIDGIERTEFSREWLEQVINNIRPRIDVIAIHSVAVNTGPNQVAYVVEIPKSDTAHQATDHRYYKRYNFQSVPMEDYEIRDVMARRQHPKFDLGFKIELSTKYERDPGDFAGTRTTAHTECELKVKAKNVGSVYAQFVNCFVRVPRPLLSESTVETSEMLGKMIPEYSEFYRDNTVRDLVDVDLLGAVPVEKYGPSRFDPILPGLSCKWDIPMTSRIQELDLNDLAIKWVIYADNAQPSKGEVLVKNIKVIDLRRKKADPEGESEA